jgi:hypothetical protein
MKDSIQHAFNDAVAGQRATKGEDVPEPPSSEQ